MVSLGTIEYIIFIRWKATSVRCTRVLHLMTIVKFALSSISNDWLFWSVNHTLISSYSELNVLKGYDLLEKFLISYQTVYWKQTYIIRTQYSWILFRTVINNITMNYTISVIARCGTFSLLLSLAILFSVLPSSFIVSGVKSSMLYPFLILNVTL